MTDKTIVTQEASGERLRLVMPVRLSIATAKRMRKVQKVFERNMDFIVKKDKLIRIINLNNRAK